MAGIKSLSISGYKSIRELKDFKLNNLNVLIGANGAGKSNFISLFRLLNEAQEQNLQIYSQVQGGPDAILHFGRATTNELCVDFHFAENSDQFSITPIGSGYKFDLIPTEDNRLIFKKEVSLHVSDTHPSDFDKVLEHGHSESVLKNATDNLSPYIRDSVRSWRVYHFYDTGDKAKVKQMHPVNDNLRLKIDAANLAPYLKMLREKHEAEYRDIVDTIRLVAPFFDDFVHRNGEEHTQLEWTHKDNPDTPFKAHILSDGTLRFMCLATLLLQPNKLLPDTVMIDEPELGLHPYAITILAEIFKEVAEEKQLIVSTQSVELVNELSPDDIIVVDLKDGESTFKRYTDEELSCWLEEYSLGEIWKRNIIGGRP